MLNAFIACGTGEGGRAEHNSAYILFLQTDTALEWTRAQAEGIMAQAPRNQVEGQSCKGPVTPHALYLNQNRVRPRRPSAGT